MLAYVSRYITGYTLTPVNARIARKLERETGENSLLIQTDWEFPGLARDMGWTGKIGREHCRHSGTDGTVTCPDCGKTASEFIQAAAAYLDGIEGQSKRVSGEMLLL